MAMWSVVRYILSCLIEDTPMIKVAKSLEVGYEIEIPIYHSDGTYLAKVKGSRLFSTKEGQKAGVKLWHPDKKTVCEIDGKTVFEITRSEAAALKTEAELYTPDGSFLKCSNKEMAAFVMGVEHKPLTIENISMHNSVIADFRIGFLVRKDGHVSIGVK